MLEMIIALAKDKDLRGVLKLMIDMMDNMERLQQEAEDSEENIEGIRDLAIKLESENNRLLKEKSELELEKRALTQFIVDEIEDEEKLNKIFL